MRLDYSFRRNLQSVRGSHQIGFVIDQKFKHSGQNAPIAQMVPQSIGRQACQIEQAICAGLVAQNPAKRSQGQSFRRKCIGFGGFGRHLELSPS